MRYYLTSCFLILLMCLRVSAQDTEAIARIDSNEVLIGDHIRLNLKVKYPSGTSIRWPQIKDTIMAGLEVLEEGITDTLRSEDGKLEIQQREYILTSFDSGFYAVPSFAFLAGSDTLETDPILLHVQTVMVDTTQAIKDIKSPYDTPFLFSEILPEVIAGGCIAILVLLLTYLYLKYRRKRQAAPVPAPVIPDLPPHEEALQQLDRLENEKLWQSGQLKAYHTRLTDIIRVYIEDRYDIPAMEQTSDEVLTHTRSIISNEETKNRLRQLLTLADMVKFARMHALPEENKLSISNARAFVEATAPVNSTATPLPRETEQQGTA